MRCFIFAYIALVSDFFSERILVKMISLDSFKSNLETFIFQNCRPAMFYVPYASLIHSKSPGQQFYAVYI